MKNGALLLGLDVDQFYGNGAPGLYSLLHLSAANNNAQFLSYRPWMKNGITLSGNDDMMYIGQKYAGNDNMDFKIQYIDKPNSSSSGVDRILRVANN